MQFMKVVTNNYLKDSRGNYNPQDKIIVTYWISLNSKWKRIKAYEYLFASDKYSGIVSTRCTDEFVKNSNGQTVKNITRFFTNYR